MHIGLHAFVQQAMQNGGNYLNGHFMPTERPKIQGQLAAECHLAYHHPQVTRVSSSQKRRISGIVIACCASKDNIFLPTGDDVRLCVLEKSRRFHMLKTCGR